MAWGKKENAITVIAAGTTIEGDVRTSGKVHVDGEIKGTLRVEGDLAIGPKGKIHGELAGVNVTVAGEVVGKAEVIGLLRVLSGGVVRDDVSYEKLEVQQGGRLLGSTREVSRSDAETSTTRAKKTRTTAEKIEAMSEDEARALVESIPPAARGQA